MSIFNRRKSGKTRGPNVWHCAEDPPREKTETRFDLALKADDVEKGSLLKDDEWRAVSPAERGNDVLQNPRRKKKARPDKWTGNKSSVLIPAALKKPKLPRKVLRLLAELGR